MKKTFIVSGAGTGIGRATAIDLAKHYSARICLIGRREDKLEETKSLLTDPQSHFVIPCDTLDSGKIRSRFKEIELDKLNLCGIIANAGLGGANIYGQNDRWTEVLSVNLTGPYILVNEALYALKNSQEKFRNIILISSILAKMGAPGHSAYCASKAGLLGLSRTWSMELGKDNIMVNCICPGWVDTNMAREGIQGIAKATGQSFEQAYQQQMALLPLGKWSDPSEIAAMVRYMVSPEQKSITGQSFDINNGALMP